MDIFNKHITNTDQEQLIKYFVQFKEKTYVLVCKDNIFTFRIYTYTLRVPRKKLEDDIYAQHSFLRKVLPRACSIVTDTDNKIICVMEGPIKFGGFRDQDEMNEDDDPNEDDYPKSKHEGNQPIIYDHSTTMKWADQGCLEITATDKANGKFAICHIFEYNGHQFLICGSKNNHVVILVSDIKEWLKNNQHMPIVVSIVQDILQNFDALTNDQIMKMFQQGWSLVGELCDGQHFMAGDNTVSWFGLFKNGVSMPTVDALRMLRDCGLKTVSFQVVFAPGTNPQLIDNVFFDARCKNNEGAVLYCRNVNTNQINLVKSKSVWYIVKRFMRQILVNKGYEEIYGICYRFIEAQSYHGLNTDASVKITKQLIQFAFWMMSKSYPVSVLGHQPVSSVRGQLANGFCVYWDRFLAETSSQEIYLTPDDFGPFDVQTYLDRTAPYTKRTHARPVTVVFIQGLQGSGKSSIANLVCELLAKQGIKAIYMEQDQFWGHAKSFMGALYHAILRDNGIQVILVSRCNTCPQQFKHYVDMALKLPTLITFVTPQIVNPLYLMISLSGIIKRSSTGDSLMVGRFEHPIAQVVEFTKKNFDDFVPQSSINVFTTHINNPELLEQATQAISTNQIISFVQANWERLNELRVDLKITAEQIIVIILNTMNGYNTGIVVNPTPNFVALAVNDEDRTVLQEFAAKYGDDTFVNYNHHCTLMFLGGKTRLSPQTTMRPGQKAVVTIDALVVRKSDNSCAYRVDTILTPDKDYQLENYQLKHTHHITSRLPKNEKAKESNNFVGLTDDTVHIIPFVRKLDVTFYWL